MANAQLNTPIFTGGILNTNFFNGRVLAAEHLTALQTANAQQRRQLARAIGDGVAWGLEVTLNAATDPTQPVVHVTAGLALDRKGDAVALRSDADLALVKTLDVQAASNGLFAACQPPQTLVPTNLDCYVLTASPASGLQGSAPTTDIVGSGFASTCASANVVEGVQFNLLPLGIANTGNTTDLGKQALQLYSTLAPQFVTLAGLTDPTAIANQQSQIAPNLSKFRNVVAHLCFGTDKLTNFAANPFAIKNGDSPFVSYGLLDDLRNQGYLTDCAVPLALVYWNSAGIQFVDIWSVRRPITPGAVTSVWPLLLDTRRRSEAGAMFLQFEDQLQSILNDVGDLTAVAADDYFAYLPPCGIVPISANGVPAVSGTLASPGLDLAGFFGDHASKDVATTDGDLLRELFSTSFEYEPMQLSQIAKIQLYLLWENLQAINGGASSQLALVFASPAIRYQGIPRFTPKGENAGPGTAIWGRSRCAPDVI